MAPPTPSVGADHVACLDIDRFQLGVVVERGERVLAADAGLLEAAEGDFDRREIVVVDPAGAGLQVSDDAMRPRQVAGEDAGGEAELGVVGASDHLVLGIEFQHAT